MTHLLNYCSLRRGFGPPNFLYDQRRISCKAIDKDRFKYTPCEEDTEAQSAYHVRLLKDFSTYFPTMSSVTSFGQLNRLLSLNKAIFEWYKEWKSNESRDSSTPDWLPSEPSFLAEWASLEESRKDFAAKELAWSKRIKDKSDELKNTVKSIDTDRAALIGTLHPYLKIERVSVNQLPQEKQLELALIENDKDREAKGKELLVAYKKDLVGLHKAGAFKDPFASAA